MISQTPTSRIIVKAFTGSEWDCCNYAVVRLPDEGLIEKILEGLKHFPDDDLSGVEYYYPAVDYLNLDDDVLDEDFAFLDDDVDVGILPTPEQRIDTQMFKVYKSGGIKFSGYGKHTSEEFWTECILLSHLYKNL